MKVADVLNNFRPDENPVDNRLYEDIVDEALKNSESVDGSSSESEDIGITAAQNQMDIEEFFVDWNHGEGTTQNEGSELMVEGMG